MTSHDDPQNGAVTNKSTMKNKYVMPAKRLPSPPVTKSTAMDKHHKMKSVQHRARHDRLSNTAMLWILCCWIEQQLNYTTASNYLLRFKFYSVCLFVVIFVFSIFRSWRLYQRMRMVSIHGHDSCLFLYDGNEFKLVSCLSWFFLYHFLLYSQ